MGATVLDDLDEVIAENGGLRAEVARLTAERDEWHERAGRLSEGLIAISEAPKTVGSAILRTIAYDIALNCMDADTARYQIRRRAGFDDEQTTDRKEN